MFSMMLKKLTLIFTGGSDIFLLKYETSGSLLFTRQVGSSGSDSGQSVVVDNVNSLVLVAGSAAGPVGGQVYAGGGSDIVLLEYSLDGVLAATEMTGTSAADSGYGVALSSAGSAFIAGYTAGALNGNVNAGGNDICLVQYISGSTGGVPSVAPSLMPAVATQNSTRPTTKPSMKPSSTPTVFPSVPSKTPTVVPSVAPSLLNTYFVYDTLGWTEQSGSSARLFLRLTNN
jgi:hypothetical protein